MLTDEQLNKALLDLQRLADQHDSIKAARELIETLKLAHTDLWVLEQKKADGNAELEALDKLKQQRRDEAIAIDADFQETQAKTAEAKAELLDEVEKIKVIRDDQTKLSAKLKAQEQAAIDDLKAQTQQAEDDLAAIKAKYQEFRDALPA